MITSLQFENVVDHDVSFSNPFYVFALYVFFNIP